MEIKDLLIELAKDTNLNQLAIAYAEDKDGCIPERQDHYRSTINRIIQNPASSRYENLERLFRILGVDIQAAIAIAATQKLKEK
ncbi:hypothetical protein [Leptothoe sp. PORK10 BA2]|uniref:hypothetical protein n=1 Tax=Leptothoe sp. PORK10 BA2 TaxID=3110254 RepID=UPI002B20A84A|nr:hypothetical protein [Leptothoe sp. PORK10 BA2]MEA5465293.1 hypothetical protein [Leptothoe sp. PORK10 BA2]